MGRAQIFVVHGRDDSVRRSFFDFFRSLGLEPLEWGEAVRMTKAANPYIGDILDAAFAQAAAVVVLLTGDELVTLRDDLVQPDDGIDERGPVQQARPNVLFEAGMAMGRYPDNTVLIEVGPQRRFSDVAGRHVVRVKTGSPTERHEIVNRLRNAGCEVVTDGKSDWLTVGLVVPPR